MKDDQYWSVGANFGKIAELLGMVPDKASALSF